MMRGSALAGAGGPSASATGPGLRSASLQGPSSWFRQFPHWHRPRGGVFGGPHVGMEGTGAWAGWWNSEEGVECVSVCVCGVQGVSGGPERGAEAAGSVGLSGIVGNRLDGGGGGEGPRESAPTRSRAVRSLAAAVLRNVSARRPRGRECKVRSLEPQAGLRRRHLALGARASLLRNAAVFTLLEPARPPHSPSSRRPAWLLVSGGGTAPSERPRVWCPVATSPCQGREWRLGRGGGAQQGRGRRRRGSWESSASGCGKGRGRTGAGAGQGDGRPLQGAFWLGQGSGEGPVAGVGDELGTAQVGGPRDWVLTPWFRLRLVSKLFLLFLYASCQMKRLEWDFSEELPN